MYQIHYATYKHISVYTFESILDHLHVLTVLLQCIAVHKAKLILEALIEVA